jgi:hypothetical protein
VATWLEFFDMDPRPSLVRTSNEALKYFARRDLLDEDVGPVENLWGLPAPEAVVEMQHPDGSWLYKGQTENPYPDRNHHLVETYRRLGQLVDKFGFDRRHPAITKAAEYIFSCQTSEGDIRGILGNQYMPYYHAVLMELLIKAGYADDPRIHKGFEWLVSMRQRGGGWVVPLQAVPAKKKRAGIWRAPPVRPDRRKPFSHLVTGMVLRAFASDPTYRKSREARLAGAALKVRFFRPDKYDDRKAVLFWTKFQYPFWWTNILTAMDSLSLVGYTLRDIDMVKGANWFQLYQGEDGLWDTAYDHAKDSFLRRWVGLAVCRVFKRLFA